MAKNAGIKLKIGRREDCVCGSGKKYKMLHGKILNSSRYKPYYINVRRKI
ncbi:SEC-C metal-binding domain-containing protein [Cysteiniphilum halobium]